MLPLSVHQALHLHVRATQTLQPRRKATATQTASSESFSPQEETGSAGSQSQLWSADAAKNLAICSELEMEDSTAAWEKEDSRSIPDRLLAGRR